MSQICKELPSLLSYLKVLLMRKVYIGAYMRASALVLLLLTSGAILSATETRAPTELRGPWMESGGDGRGQIIVIISESTEQKAAGEARIEGSPLCTRPVKFKGVVVDKIIQFESTEQIVCGFGGKLAGQIEHTDAGTYTGTFAYRLWGMTVFKGSFVLSK